MARRIPKEQTKTYQRRQASIKRKKERNEAVKKSREVNRRANKLALEKLAEETFGEEGLTPARQQALAQVLLGPDAGDLTITNPYQLRVYVGRARKRFHELAENYVNVHFRSTKSAMDAGEFDVAARHAEWAMEHLGDKEERLVEPTPKVPAAPNPTPSVMVGVNLGGIPRPQEGSPRATPTPALEPDQSPVRPD